MNISESIVNAQHLKKMKNHEVARLANISGTYYSTLRSGKTPSIELMETLALTAFNMKVSEFIALGESK